MTPRGHAHPLDISSQYSGRSLGTRNGIERKRFKTQNFNNRPMTTLDGALMSPKSSRSGLSRRVSPKKKRYQWQFDNCSSASRERIFTANKQIPSTTINVKSVTKINDKLENISNSDGSIQKIEDPVKISLKDYLNINPIELNATKEESAPLSQI